MDRKETAMLEFAVLGLLHESPMHGYELRKRLNAVLGAFRAFSYGSLYPCLRRMKAAGWISEDQPVSAEAAPAGEHGRGFGADRLVLADPPSRLHPAQARVERAVREGAEGPEYGVEPLAQLVSVHRRLVQQSEDGELEHRRLLSVQAGSSAAMVMSAKPRMCRTDVSV